MATLSRVSVSPVQSLILVLTFLVALVFSLPAQAQHLSTECPPQTATVASGGTVTINITDCASNIGFAGIGDIDGGSTPPLDYDYEDHGVATTRIVGSQWFLDYSHNGSTGIGGTDVFELTGADGTGNDDVLFTITITPSASPITVLPSALPALTAGTPMSQTLTSSGGVGSYSYTLQSGALPLGLTLTSGGVISGTPTQRGAYSFSVRSTDSNGQFVDRGYTGSVANPTLSIAPGSATATRNAPFSQTLTVTGGVAPYAFQIETGSLPSGITLSTGGVISGTTSAMVGPYPITLRVTDSSTGPGQYFEVENFTLNLTNNQAPTANAGTDQTVASGAGVTLNGTGSSDPEAQALSYTWSQTGGPTVTLSSTSAAQPTFTAPVVAWNASPAVLTFSLTVNDGVQNSAAADTVTITVNPEPNQIPTANAGTDQTVASGAGVTLNGNGSTDPEAQSLSYAWNQTGGPTVTLFSPGTAQPTFTAPTVAFNAAPAVLTFSLIVNDGVQSSVADTVTVTVNPAPNQAPTADAGTDQTVASGAGVTLNGTGSTDPEAQALSYTWSQTGGPTVTLSSTSAAQPTFTAPTVAWNAAPAVLTFSLTVNDGVQNSAAADTVTITVNPEPNQAPTANAGTDQTVASAAGVTLNGTGSTDPEAQALSYTWSQTGGPTVTLSSTSAAQPTFTAPVVAWNASPAVLTFSLTVNDGVQNSAAADTVSITVNPEVNQTPTANAGPNQTVASTAGVTLDGTGSSDPENQVLSYTWSQTGGPTVTLSSTSAAQPTFTAPVVAWNASPAVLTFSLTVNDGVQNSAAADTVQITVNPEPNLAPTANAGGDQTVASGAGVTLDGTGSTDPEAQTLSYTWSQTGGPTVTLSSTSAAQPTFTAPVVAWNAAPAVLTFSLTVNDGLQNSAAADTVTITVNPEPNQAPTANAGGDQTVASAAGVTLDGTGSTDPEAQALSYTWSQTGGPTVTIAGSNTAQPTFTAPTLGWNAPDATLTFSLTVNDGVQDSLAPDSVTITVTAPVDVTNPTVTLAGMPASVLPGEVVQLTVTFSEPVTGLDLGDFAVSNGVAFALSQSGTSYVVTIEAGGGGVLSVSLPADSAFDVALNGNLASNTLESGAGAVEETEEAIATYLQQRANALVGAQPGLIRLLQPSGRPQVAVSSKGFTYATSGDHPIWASITGQWGEAGDADTRYILGAVGTHVWLNERAILGVLLEFDQMKLSEPGRTVSGTGWLIGPYIAGQIQDHPLFYEGRVLWGKTSNEVEQFGLPADSFDSERMLAQFKLQGEMMLGTTKLLPFIDGSYVSDEQEAYVDGLGNPIAAQTVEQSQVALGLDLNWTLASGGGVLEPMAGLSAVYTDSSGSGAAALVEPAFQGWRGKLKAGLRYSTGSSIFDMSTFVDGLGTPDYRDYGLALSFSTQF